MVTAGTSSPPGVRLAPGTQLGDYRIGPALWPMRIADAYRADGPAGPATIYVIHPRIAQDPGVRNHIIAGTRAAAALPEHRHLVRTLAAGLTGDILWIAAEDIEGSLARDLLLKKRQAGGTGLGARATGNLITGVAAALAEVAHGALASESIAVSRTGRVRVIDLALGPGTLAAMVAGLIPPASSLAPETLAGAPPGPAADVHAIGALLYESLVGQPLERGGPRPSDVVEGVNTQIDQVVARACHREPDKRFGRADVLGEVVAEALQRGGGLQTAAVPTIATAPTLGDHQASLASEIAAQGAAAGGSALDERMRIAGGGAPGGSADGAGALPRTVDLALAAAVADTTEKWLISKARMDYGPFSLADVIAQIEGGEIVAGNVIQDKDSGARGDVAEHPLLGPLVEAARQRRDDQRRAQAEVREQSRDKKRGAMLYGMIALGVLGAAAAVYLVLRTVQRDDGGRRAASVSALDGASLKVTVSPPKKPAPAQRRPGGRRPAGGPAPANTGENLALDMSDDSDETETLDMGAVYGVYSRHGGKLGGCLQSTGERAASIGIIIDGPSGRVTWVKVNDKQAGALYSCLGGVLRGMQFPRINGPRTRAEFEIAM
jgi:eukaryotic-like serine/threonine-protein kinase